MTSFLQFVREADLAAVLRLLDDDPNLARARDRRDDDCRALHVAARVGSAAMVALLLEAGAEPNAHDARGRTALGDAAERGHLDVVRILVEAGANLDGPGQSAFASARNRGDREMADYLRRVLFGRGEA